MSADFVCGRWRVGLGCLVISGAGVLHLPLLGAWLPNVVERTD